MTLPSWIETVETDERVAAIEPALTTRFRWRADRRAAKLNAARIFPSYRWEVVEEAGRFTVAAFQNIARDRRTG